MTPRHPGTINVDDVWRLAARCAGAGAGLVIHAHDLDVPFPRGDLVALVVEIMREFGFEPHRDLAAYAEEFTSS